METLLRGLLLLLLYLVSAGVRLVLFRGNKQEEEEGERRTDGRGRGEEICAPSSSSSRVVLPGRLAKNSFSFAPSLPPRGQQPRRKQEGVSLTLLTSGKRSFFRADCKRVCVSGTLGRFIGVRDHFHENFICRWLCVFTRPETAVTNILFNGIMSISNATDLESLDSETLRG